MGITADRELLTFLETSKGEDPNKSNSLPHGHAGQAKPNVAWTESKEPANLGLTNLHLRRASRERTGSNYIQLPPPQSDDIEIEEVDTASINLYHEQQRADSDKYRFNVPCVEGQDTAPWDLSVEEHELVTGLLKFSLSGANAMEDPSTSHFEIGATDLETLGDSSLRSLSTVGDLVSSCRTSKETLYKTEQSSNVTSHVLEAPEPSSDSPTSTDSSVSEGKGHGPVFCASDTTDCLLAIDLSEGNDPKLGVNKAKREDGAMALFMNDLQAGGTPVLGMSSSLTSDKDDPSSKLGLAKEKPVKSKEGLGPKRNSLKEKSPSSTKPSSGPPNPPRPVRTLNASENASMRKVVPISRSTKAPPPSCTKKPESKPAARETNVGEPRLSRRNSVRGIADTVPKPPYRHSISVEEPKLQRGTTTSSSGHFEREQLQHKGSLKKPSCKPVRNVPKSKNDETKMCRSSTKSQPAADTSKSAAVIIPKTPVSVPSFARNTVASSSRCAKVELPATPRVPTLTRSLSQRLPRMKITAASDDSNPKENSGGTLKRANSARMIKRSTDNSDILSVKGEPILNDQAIMEKSDSLKFHDGTQTPVGKLLNHY